MPTMLRRLRVLQVPLILLSLLIAICAPPLLGGYANLERASRESKDKFFSLAAADYDSAARLLPWRPELLEKAAVAYASAGEWGRAMTLFELARKHQALSADGWDVFGTGYWLQSKNRQAVDIWSGGLQQYPATYKFYSRLALAYRGLADYVREKQALQIWLLSGQGTAREHYRLGQLLMAWDPQEATRELAIAGSTDASVASAVQTMQAALSVAAGQPNESQRLVVIARGLALVDEWPLAEQELEQAVKVDARNAEAWAWLGEAHQQVGKDGKAELDRALALDANDTIIHALRGMYWKRQGRYAGALTEYKNAAQLEPQNPEWQVALGEAYALTGDLASGLASYQRATAISPENADYWRMLAMFCADNAVQVIEVGLPAARKAAQLAPRNPEALDALGWSYAQAGLLYNAEETLLKASALKPDFALAHLHLGEAYLRKGDRPAALRELDAARQLDADGTVGALAGQLLKQYFP